MFNNKKKALKRFIKDYSNNLFQAIQHTYRQKYHQINQQTYHQTMKFNWSKVGNNNDL